MIVWTVWIQGETTWLETAWDDDSVAENHEGYMKAVRAAFEVAEENGSEARVIKLDVPFGKILEAFALREVKTEVLSDRVPPGT